MPKITEMFAFVVADKDENDEGIIGAENGLGWILPLVGADMDRVKSIIPVADKIAKATGKKYKILKFALVGEVERK